MEILNHELEWHQIAMVSDIRNAFRGTPAKVLLSPGTKLCRFITTESKARGIRGNETFRSAWWMSWDKAFGEIRHWGAARATPKEVIRGRMAVTAEFNSELDSLVQIILTRPVHAWKGVARHQDDPIRKVTYLGGGEQLYVPNLASDDKGLSSSVAYIHCFTSIDSLV